MTWKAFLIVLLSFCALQLVRETKHLTCKVANKCLNVHEWVGVVKWNESWPPPFPCLMRYPDQENCDLSHLEQYIEKTKDLWKNQNLLINFVKPQKLITTWNISRWCIIALRNTGVEVAVFGSHSTRSALTAHCKRKELSMKQINKGAGWPCSKAFAKHYNKPIVNESRSCFKDCIRVIEI